MKSLYSIFIFFMLIFFLSGCKKSTDNGSSDSQTRKLISGDFYFNIGQNTLCQTSDNGFTVAALIGGYKIYIAKTNSAFDILWTKTYGSNISSVGGIVESSDKGFVIVSNYIDTTSYPYKLYVDLIKLNQSGDLLWEKKYRFNYLYESGFALRETPDKGFIIITIHNDHLDLFKINSTGDSIWSRNYTDYSIISGLGSMDIQITSDKGFIAVEDGIILKTDSLGNKQWDLETSANDLTNIRVLPDGSFVALGNESIGIPTSSNSLDYVLMKFDASGNKLWEKLYDVDNYEWPANLCLTPEGGFIFTGKTKVHTENIDETVIIKTDENGNKLAMKTINLGDDAQPRGLILQNGSYVYYGGTTLSTGTAYYLMFLRFNM
jgi:hypothetical protein